MKIDLPTPRIVVDAAQTECNIKDMSEYTGQHGIHLRPHTKTHKSIMLARMQLEAGAVGLAVAKVGEARQMSQAGDDILMAYPPADSARCQELAQLATENTLRVGVDSLRTAATLSQAASSAQSTIGVLVDIDVGMHRTGVQTPEDSLELAQHVDRLAALRLDGIMFYPGHLADPTAAEAKLREIDETVTEAIDQWKRHGLAAKIVSGGSTPTARLSHVMSCVTEIRPGTYVYHDMNCVHGGYATLDQCAAQVMCTVISAAVPGQVVIDAGTKTLTSDVCGPAPQSGHGYVMEYPEARITRLTEEHGQVDISKCEAAPQVGDRVRVIPNHICPCINLQDTVWWLEGGEERPISVDARGKVF